MAIKNVNTERLLQEALNQVNTTKPFIDRTLVNFFKSQPQFSPQTIRGTQEWINNVWNRDNWASVKRYDDGTDADRLLDFVFSSVYDEGGEGRSFAEENPKADDVDVALARFVTYVGDTYGKQTDFWKINHYDIDHNG